MAETPRSFEAEEVRATEVPNQESADDDDIAEIFAPSSGIEDGEIDEVEEEEMEEEMDDAAKGIHTTLDKLGL